jgi:photosystem I subunit 3
VLYEGEKYPHQGKTYRSPFISTCSQADISGLTPCAESAQFEKKKAQAIKKLDVRLKKYDADSAPAVANRATMDRTEARFKNYADAGLLCGADGLPHLIADPGLATRYGHSGEIFIPTFGFLYAAGAIGWAGREYLKEARKEKKPSDMEIIIDVPKALAICARSFGWPIFTMAELKDGTLTEKAENITVSPR